MNCGSYIVVDAGFGLSGDIVSDAGVDYSPSEQDVGDVVTFGGSLGLPIIPIGGAFSFDRVTMENRETDWFITIGIGLSTPGAGFAIDIGKTTAVSEDEFTGPSVSINADFFPIGYEVVIPGWDPTDFVNTTTEDLLIEKGGVHAGEGANLLWNWTFDIGK